MFPGDTLAAGTLVVAVGAYTPRCRNWTRRRSNGRIASSETFPTRPQKPAIYASIPISRWRRSAASTREFGRHSDDEILVLESVGSAVLDAATAEYVLDRADEAEIGTTVLL